MTESKTSSLERLIIDEDARPRGCSAWASVSAWVEAAIAEGLVEGPADSVEVLVRRVLHRYRPTKVVIASDFHVPYHNKRLVENWLNFLVDAQPDVVIVNGDFLDCEAISRFLSAPGGPTLQDEIDAGAAILEAIEGAAPSAALGLGEGNHEERLRRLIGENPGLYNLRALTIPALLGATPGGARWEWQWFKYGEEYTVGKLSAIHGHKVSKHSAYTAKAHLLDGGYDVVVHGHTHRLGAYWLTGVKGTRRGFEAGCMCDIDHADYVVGSKNWQNGFAVAYVWPGGDAHVQLIEATKDGAFVAEGKTYR